MNCPSVRCANWIKAGCEYSDVPVTCVDDRLYDSITERHGGLAKKYLINVIKASDLASIPNSNANTFPFSKLQIVCWAMIIWRVHLLS